MVPHHNDVTRDDTARLANDDVNECEEPERSAPRASETVRLNVQSTQHGLRTYSGRVTAGPDIGHTGRPADDVDRCSCSCWSGCGRDACDGKQSPGASSLNTDSIAHWQLWLTVALTGRLLPTAVVDFILKPFSIYTVVDKKVSFLFLYYSFGKCGSILIILPLRNSHINYGRNWNKTYQLTSNLLPHYLAKYECSPVTPFIYIRQNTCQALISFLDYK